jgi:hypothetical protein
MPYEDLDKMSRPELFARFRNICPHEYDSCHPCGRYICGRCQHPEHPDNIIARRVRARLDAKRVAAHV